jgi:hypothetical protein
MTNVDKRNGGAAAKRVKADHWPTFTRVPHPDKPASDQVVEVAKLDAGQEGSPLLGGEPGDGRSGISRVPHDNELTLARDAYTGTPVASARRAPVKALRVIWVY